MNAIDYIKLTRAAVNLNNISTAELIAIAANADRCAHLEGLNSLSLYALNEILAELARRACHNEIIK